MSTESCQRGRRAARYLAYWRALGYTGDYVPRALREADAAECHHGCGCRGVASPDHQP